MLTKTDESDLWIQYKQEQTPELREALVLRSVPLVYFVLGRLGISQAMGSEYEDLVHQGLMGLIEAVDHFNADYGTKFSTYASVRIRGKVLDYLRSQDWLSRSARHRARSIQGAINQLWEKTQRDPTEDEIAEFLKLDVEKVQQGLADSSRMIVSLDTLLEPDQDTDGSLHEVLPDRNQPDPSDVVDELDLRERLVDAIRDLSEREQLVLSLYYYEELTFKEIGAVLEITESRVCQLHARAIYDLKARMNHV